MVGKMSERDWTELLSPDQRKLLNAMKEIMKNKRNAEGYCPCCGRRLGYSG